MKKIIAALVLMVMPSLMFAQSGVFDKYEDNDVVTSVVVNKKMFELMGNVKMDAKDKEAQQYLNLVKKLDNLKVFTTNDAKTMTEMRGTVSSYLKKFPLDELMKINEGGRTIKIYVRSGATSSQVRELLMFMDGGKEETVIMSLTGNFDLNEVSVLTDKMNLPGGNELKKASAKKQ